VDGIRRYVEELLRALLPIADLHHRTWTFDIALGALGIFRLQDAAEFLQRRELSCLKSEIWRLLQPHDDNPIQRCRTRLEKLNGRKGWAWMRETMRLQCLKTARSSLRRWNDVKAITLSLRQGYWSVYDVIHLTLPNTWHHFRRYRARFLTTVHDLSHIVHPEMQSAKNIRSLAEGVEFAQRVGSHYIAVSNSTRQQMERRLGIDAGRIHVIPEACDRRRFEPVTCAERLDATRSKYGLPRDPFLLFVGTIEPRKNLLNTVLAFRQLVERAPALPANLVIAGARGWGDQSELAGHIQQCPRIRMIGYVDDEDLPALYSLCAAFCYVSHYEGFGLPLLEAMTCGAPPIYGNVASMPEIAAGAGIGVSPQDTHQIAAAMGRMLEDRTRRERLAHQALCRAREFSWEATARRTFACYQRLMDQRSTFVADDREAVERGACPLPVEGNDRRAIGGGTSAAA
jgi:glycosyltransferase involved in cell wall biosynthesis